MQDLHAIDKTVILKFPIVPNPNTVLPIIPTDLKWITVVETLLYLVSQLTRRIKIYLPSLGKINNIPEL